MEAYQSGLCVWNDASAKFEPHRVLWTKSEATPQPPPAPSGHSVAWTDPEGKAWVLFGNPLPKLRCPATFEAWQDPARWQILNPQAALVSCADNSEVKPHSGSM